MKRILQNTGLNAIAAVFDRGGIVVLTALLSGALSAEAFRDFGQFQLTLTMLASFSSVGLVISVSRLFAEHATGRSDHFSLVGTMWLMSLGAALVLGVGVVLASLVAPVDVGVPPAFLLAGLVMLTLGLVAGGGVLGLGLFRQAAGMSVITAAVLLGLGAWAAAERSVVLAATAVVAAYAVNSLLSTVLVLRRASWRAMFRSRPLSGAALKGVALLLGPLALVTLMAASANWLLGQMLLHRAPNATEAFSGFIIGLQWFALAQFLPGLVGRAVFPDLVTAGEGQRRILRQGIAMSVLLSVTVTVGVLIASPLLATLYPASIVGGGALLAAFAMAALPQSVAGMVGNVLVARGMQAAWARLSALWFVVLIGAGWMLMPFGATGSAIALAIAGVCLAASAVFVARRAGLL